MFEILTFPFMQRALAAGLISAVLLGWIGVFVTSKKMSFIGDGVAHASLAAVAFAILFGLAPLPVALIFGVLFSVLLYTIQKKTVLSQDTVIGMLFVTGMALGILLLQFHDGYVPELVSYLFGNILSVRPPDLLIMVFIGLAVFAALVLFRRAFTFIAVDPEGAELSGMNRTRMELLLYIVVSIAVILSIKLIGVVLVSALLITPSAIGKTIAWSFASLEGIAVVASIGIMILGLLAAYVFDVPPGASIVLTGTAAFLVTRVVVFFVRRV